jgi:hypothetical protein
MRETTQKQHFVPKFYLRRFADNDDWIQVLDLKRNKIVKPAAYPSVCWRRLFYAAEEGKLDDTSQEFEQMFERIEDSISKDWDGILDRAVNKHLQPEDFMALAQFVAMLMLRTKANRDNFNRNMENVDKAVYGLVMRNENFDDEATVRKYRAIGGENVSVEELKAMQEVFVNGEFSLSYDNVSFLKFILSQLEGFSNVMITGQWTIYRRTEQFQFITNENPVVEWAPRETGFYGTARLARWQYIAISPDVMIKIEPPPLPNPFPEPKEAFPPLPLAFETARYKESSDIDVVIYNFLLTGCGSAYAYAQRRLELDALIEQHQTRGGAYRIYSAAFAT